MNDRLSRQVDFILELDRLKNILRQTTLADGSRFENSAEHSWHLALMANLLGEHGPDDLDIAKTTRMLLVHDVVEIDAGDTFCYDAEASVGKFEREELAAERIFGLLSDDLAAECLELWHEFEERSTPEARFANAVDRFQPMLLNIATEGGSWRRHGIRREQVEKRLAPIGEGSPRLWEYTQQLLDDADQKGWFGSAPTDRSQPKNSTD
ncbi:MAG: HD domain-containing protein [Thermoanaerobaculia bacterium]|nr:HD domain-containing protein [Thermoanaerobaculia bacterium]